MGIREKINQHQPLFIGVAIAIIAIGVYFSVRNAGVDTGGGSLTQVYFSVDDGQTYFADDATKIAPFDHDGKQAFQAFVFKCGGETKVHYLARFTEAGRKVRGGATGGDASGDVNAAPAPGGEASGTLVEYKRPGETAWVAVQPQPKCPSGEYPEMVNP